MPCSHGSLHDATVVLPAGVRVAVGVFAPNRWNDGAGLVQVRYSDVPSLYVAVVRWTSRERMQAMQPRQLAYFLAPFMVVIIDNPWQT